MGFGVTETVTSGYNGYKRFKAVQAVSFSVQKVQNVKRICLIWFDTFQQVSKGSQLVPKVQNLS